MAEYIEREAVLEHIESLRTVITGLREGKGILAEFWIRYRHSILSAINEFPAANVAPVVRCKDCKHCDSARDCIHPENIHHYYDGEGYDYESFHMVDPDHFCSYGERKDGDGK